VTPLLADLGMTFSEMGLILGSWQFTYIGIATVAGTVTDRIGVRAAIFIGLLVICLSAGLRYFVTGFAMLLAAVMLFGVGAPLISIGAPTAISHWFSGKSRGVAVGIYTTGMMTGGLIALSATNSLVMPLTGFSWRLTFVCYGAVTLAIALVWLFGGRNAGRVTTAKKPGFWEVFPRLVLVVRLRIVLLGGLLAFASFHGLSNWLPKLFENRGMDPVEAGFLASLPVFVGLFAVLLVPTLTAPLARGRMVSCLALANILSMTILAVADGGWVFVGLVIFGITGPSIFPLLALLLMDTPEVEANIMGMASGLFFAVAEIGGFSGPLVIGTLYDWTGSFLSGIAFMIIVNLTIVVLGLRLRTR